MVFVIFYWQYFLVVFVARDKGKPKPLRNRLTNTPASYAHYHTHAGGDSPNAPHTHRSTVPLATVPRRYSPHYFIPLHTLSFSLTHTHTCAPLQKSTLRLRLFPSLSRSQFRWGLHRVPFRRSAGRRENISAFCGQNTKTATQFWRWTVQWRTLTFCIFVSLAFFVCF